VIEQADYLIVWAENLRRAIARSYGEEPLPEGETERGQLRLTNGIWWYPIRAIATLGQSGENPVS
jgi:hypothetical protein